MMFARGMGFEVMVGEGGNWYEGDTGGGVGGKGG